MAFILHYHSNCYSLLFNCNYKVYVSHFWFTDIFRIFTVTYSQQVFKCTLSVIVKRLKPIFEHLQFDSVIGDTDVVTVDISGHERALLDLIACSCAFTSVITSLRAPSDGCICIRGLPSRTVSTSDAEFLLLVCNLFIYMYYVYYLLYPLLPVRLKAGNVRYNSPF